MEACPVEVVKVGGSLLDRPDLLPALAEWLGEQEPLVHRVLIVGGGAAVAGLRRLDDVLGLDEQATHWHAIGLMDFSGRAVGLAAPWPAVASWEELGLHCAGPGTTQFLAGEFLHEIEHRLPGTPLREGWQVTSDSISARIAICLGARRLVLLKSRPATIAERHDWSLAARQRLVDEFFFRLAPAIPEIECQMLPFGPGLKN